MPIIPTQPTTAGWTYGGDPTANTRDAVRFLVQDTDPADPLLSDAEIGWSITQEDNLYLAAALCLDVLASKFARLAQSETNGDVSESYGDRSQRFEARAAALRDRAARGGRAPMAYAGGLTQSDEVLLTLDTDAVQPYFTTGGMDHRGESVTGGYGLNT